MEADFSGYATKAGLKCTDGRTIMPEAFKHQNQTTVPLVWQHSHNDPENILGHVLLESRDEGVYGYGFFNKSAKATHAHEAIEHGDIKFMSIWANQLVERAKVVLHGAIREVSLVLSGANPGALIDNISIRHSDGMDDEEVDEAIIFTGLTLVHGASPPLTSDVTDTTDTTTDDSTNDSADDKVEHADKDDSDDDEDETVEDVYNSMSKKQKDVLHYMIGEAIQSAGSVQQDNLGNNDTDSPKGNEMMNNVFEGKEEDKKPDRVVLSHSDIEEIVADATRTGSLKEAVNNYALQHDINNIDILFPDAQALNAVPEFIQRRSEWVSSFLSSTRKSPFSRIKTISADLTLEDARAKGYVTGALKKEEFFGVAKRVTTPTTVYKKQKLDRDDMVDITDFDVVAWLKAEMRVMLDEEIARAALIGDGRDVAHEDKINEQNVRPISKDHELFVTTVNVNISDASSSIAEMVDAVVANRHFLKGTGLPTMYTTESVLAKFLLLKDTLGRRIYRSVDEVATEMRVSSVVTVEVMEEDPTTLAILVNPADYVYGATRGGEVSMFDDFDIDYNQYKYLIETRLCGALTKLKSAMVVKSVPGAAVLATPAAPTFVEATGIVTIPTVTGVVYKNNDTQATLTAGPQTALAVGATLNVQASPSGAGYYFATGEDDSWSFTR